MEEMEFFRKVAKMAEGNASAEDAKAVLQAMECDYKSRHCAELVAGALKSGSASGEKEEKTEQKILYKPDI